MTTVTVHPLRLSAQLSHARLMRDHGMGLARNAGTVRSIAAEYALSGIRTWAQLAAALEPIKDAIDAERPQALVTVPRGTPATPASPAIRTRPGR